MSHFLISSGRINSPKKVCVYGVSGVGKTTFAARFPDPLFIDTENGSGELDVNRLPRPTSWQMLLDEIAFVADEKPCRTLVIDTVDWAEQLCIDMLLAKHGKNGIEDFGYGNGYVYEKEEFARFLNRLEDVIAAGIHVVLTAHAQTRKFSQPDEIGEYDRYELKLGKKTGSYISPLIKEWSDMLLFANFKTFAVAVDKEGKKFKAQGGTERIMYTEHHACFDAKNRYGLPSELPFTFDSIAHLFADHARTSTPQRREPLPELPTSTVYWTDGKGRYKTDDDTPPVKDAVKITKEDYDKIGEALAFIEAEEKAAAEVTDTRGIPPALADLMTANGVTEDQIRRAVASRGYFPEEMRVKDYPKEFIEGCLIGAWEQVYNMIKKGN